MNGEKGLLLMVPLLLFLHNAEEMLTMPQWMDAHLPMLQERIPLFHFFTFSTRQLYISLIQVTLIPFIVSILCLRGELTARSVGVMLTLQSIIFWNALMPHLTGSIFLGLYNPGTYTAVLFNIPFSIFLYRRSIAFNIFPAQKIRKFLLAGALLYLPLVYANHLLAKGISSLY